MVRLLSDPGKMGVKTLVGLPYQFTVEALFAPAGFVSCHE
jgi:hypothetical protein